MLFGCYVENVQGRQALLEVVEYTATAYGWPVDDFAMGFRAELDSNAVH